MLEKLKKLGRGLMRSYEDDAFGTIAVPALMAIPVTALGALGGVLGSLVFPTITAATAAGVALGAGYALLYIGKTIENNINQNHREITKNRLCFSNAAIMSSKRNAYLLNSTQKRISSLTQSFQKVAQLPPKIEKKIQDYLDDAAEFAAQVRAYDAKGQEQDEITFTREIFQGQKTKIPVGAVKTIKGLTPAPPTVDVPVPAVKSPAPSGIKVAAQPLQFKNRPAQNIK